MPSDKRKAADKRHSEFMRVKKETENMLDVHRELKSRFFAPTQAQIDRFDIDIPKFLKQYTKVGRITEACKGTHLTPDVVHHLNNREPSFKEDFEIAKKIFADRLDDIATERAINGTPTPTTFQGQHVQDIDVLDNRLLETVLKAKLPEKYDRKNLDRIPDAKKPQLNLNIVNFNVPDPVMGNVSKVEDDGTIIRAEVIDKERIITDE